MGSVTRTRADGILLPEMDLIAAAFDAMPTPVVVASGDGSIRAVNSAFTELTGLTAGEIDDDRLREIVRDAAGPGGSRRYEWMCPRKSGRPFPAELTVAPIRGLEGDALLVGTLDVARPALTSAEQDFELFFNLIPDLAVIAHVDGHFKRVNPAWETTLGWTQEEVLSRPFLEFVHPDDLEATAEEAGRQSRSYRTRHFVNRYRAKNGSYRLLEWQSTFNRDELTRFGIARDITEQRQWEDSLRESEERFRIMADSCPTIIWVTGADGRIRLTNRMFREFFGAAWERAETPADKALIHPDDREEYAERFARAVRDRAPFRAEARVRTSDGQWRWIASHAEPRLSASGEFLGHVGISPDITERKEAEVALHYAKQTAEAANRAKSEFLAHMSHEIRTPMNAVIGLTDLTLGTELTADQRAYLESVQCSAESLLRILNDILDFSKIEAGKLDFETVEFDVRRLVESTLKSVAVRAASKELELVSEAGADVPRHLMGDAARLRQVLVNILGNAIKFTDRGEVTAHVETTARTDHDVELHFQVRDTGIGIAAENLEHVFRPFAQADASTTRRFEGTGLGLTISSQLVARMGGRIWVESEEGRGSTFHFTVRLGKAGEERGDAGEDAGLRALVAEDNRTNREMLVGALSRRGWRMSSAEGGQAALEMLRQAAREGAPYSLLVLDGGLPDLGRFAVLEAIRADEELHGVRVALLQPALRPGDAARAQELGAISLAKPVGELELMEAIGRAKPEARAGMPAPTMSSLRILIVEDNPVNRMLATRLLETHGHHVACAANGQEALAVIGRETFDCVLMDVQMPVMDGFEATAAIRRSSAGGSLPVIAMTAHAMAGDLERCLAAGMDAYVTKPVNAADLLAAIEAARAKRAG